jgi:flagella basal body P-ring formation protein FlgA
MTRKLVISSLMGTLILVLCGAAAKSATIQLRGQARVDGAVVRLGDVADIFDAHESGARQLAAIELGTAPGDGSEKSLRLREIQDLLSARGVDLSEHTFSGAAAVRMTRGEVNGTKVGRARRVTSTESRLAQRRAQEAILAYLRENVAEDEPWNVEVTLSDADARQLAAATTVVSAAGGDEPWIGKQQFELSIKGSVPVSVEANVTLPANVVVAVRPLVRGDIVRASDVALQRGKAGVAKSAASPDATFGSIENVVGLEVIRPVAAGAVLTSAAARKPLLVQRGEVVTVCAYSSGIRVKTTARSRQAGSEGDLIEVESLSDRARYFARVSGVQQVEVFASAERVKGGE